MSIYASFVLCSESRYLILSGILYAFCGIYNRNKQSCSLCIDDACTHGMILYFIKNLMSRVRTPSGKKCHKSVLALTLFFLFLLRFFLPTTHQCCIRLYASPTLMKLENSPSFYALPYKLRMKPPALPRGMGFLSVLYTFRFLNFVVMGTFFVSLLSFFFFFCSFSLFSCVFLFVFLFSIFFFFSFLLFLFAQKLACIQQKNIFCSTPRE